MDWMIGIACLFTLQNSIKGWVFSIAGSGGVNVPSVCYDHLGCFDAEYPFDNAGGELPSSPEDIGVTLYVYSEDPMYEGTYVKTELNIDDELPDTFNANRSVALVIHGYNEDINKPYLQDLFGELIEYGSLNVIIVDWGEGAHALYDKSVANTRVVGAVVVRHLRQMFETTLLTPESVHLIGYSLGAHVAGYVGHALPRIGRITALDPAGPLFEGTSMEVRLDGSDALFVDIIHTNGAPLYRLGFGMTEPIGHVDFYPNGGRRQPGCGNAWDRFMSLIYGRTADLACSHRRSVELFTESINSDCAFRAKLCSFDGIKDDHCGPCVDSSCVVMGYHVNRAARGTFYLSTDDSRPFCAG